MGIGLFTPYFVDLLSDLHFCRTGDRECPMRLTGNTSIEVQRLSREDPMNSFVAEKMKQRSKKHERVEELKRLVDNIRQEEQERKHRKLEKKEDKKKRKEKRLKNH